jgi:hypothetical protein
VGLDVEISEAVYLSGYHDLVSLSNSLLKKNLALEEGVMITRNLSCYHDLVSRRDSL